MQKTLCKTLHAKVFRQFFLDFKLILLEVSTLLFSLKAVFAWLILLKFFLLLLLCIVISFPRYKNSLTLSNGLPDGIIFVSISFFSTTNRLSFYSLHLSSYSISFLKYYPFLPTLLWSLLRFLLQVHRLVLYYKCFSFLFIFSVLANYGPFIY